MNYIKMVFAAVSAFVLSLFGILAPWVRVLAIAMILDYATGLWSAYVHDELNSRVGITGIGKKLCYLVVVAVTMIVDWIIVNGGDLLGVKLPMTGFVALLAIVWLIINELISILENLSKIGVKGPAWLGKLMEHLKTTTEGKGDKLNV